MCIIQVLTQRHKGKVQSPFHRINLPALEFVFNDYVKNEVVEYIILLTLKDEFFVEFASLKRIVTAVINVTQVVYPHQTLLRCEYAKSLFAACFMCNGFFSSTSIKL